MTGDPRTDTAVEGRLTVDTLTLGVSLNWLKEPCPAPAPLVVNGAQFVGCQLAKGHDGAHKVEITWADR